MGNPLDGKGLIRVHIDILIALESGKISDFVAS